MGTTPSVPDDEINALLTMLSEAVEAAAAGRAVEGHQHLVAGRDRAELFEEDGEAWGAALVEMYEKALARFRERWEGTG